MARDPLEEMARRLNSDYAGRPSKWSVRTGAESVQSGVYPEGIPPVDDPVALACVDGGGSLIMKSPTYSCSLNRLYCSVWRGTERLPCPLERIQYLSMLSATEGSIGDIEAYVDCYDKSHLEYIPEDNDLASLAAELQDAAIVHARGRTLGEWKVAGAAAQYVEGGAVVVDGALSEWGVIRRNMLDGALEGARSHGAILCGLSKRSGKLTDSGKSVVESVMELAGDIRAPWYADIFRTPFIRTLVVKLHDAAKYAYRLDVDAQAGDADLMRLLGSLAANSGDATMPGYPYGLIDADRWAQVRNDEAKSYWRSLSLMLTPQVRRSVELQGQHEALNQITS